MDNLLRSWENSIRRGMRVNGAFYHLAASTMAMNPYLRPWATAMKDYGRFLNAKAQPIAETPWVTENKIVLRRSRVILRKFSHRRSGTPLLLVPPEAGHNSQIVDYGPGQSLVQCALAHFDGDVYVMEKLPAARAHGDSSIADAVRSLHRCIQHIGRPVHLVGLCQGGWQSAVYTALYAERVRSLTLAGAPIDFHAGDGLLRRWTNTLPMSFFRSLVALGDGRMPGAFIAAGFKLMNPYDRFIGDDLNLYRNINNPDYLARHLHFNQWYQFTQPLGGRMYLEVVEQLFKANKLIKGLLEVAGRRVDLSRIHQPLFLVAGSNDIITPPEQLFAIRHHVSSALIEEKLAEAGHIGVFMRRKVIQTIWKDIFVRLCEARLGEARWSGSIAAVHATPGLEVEAA